MKPLFFFAGPSGGHVFPSQAVAEGLHKKNKGLRIFLITCRRAQGFVEGLCPAPFEQVFYLPEFGWPTHFKWAHLVYLWNIPCSLFITFWLYLRHQPSFCFGAGSFVSFMGVWVGKIFRVPILIHEQNATAGKATRASVAYADRVALSFHNTKSVEGCIAAEWTGLPIRESLWEASKTIDSVQKSSEAVHLLVTGGSQGSHVINSDLIKILANWPLEKRAKIAVKHIAGAGDLETLKENYASLDVSAEVFSFVKDMAPLYEWAHACVSRAGANSLWETALFGLQVFTVPYPFAGSHQIDNARAFETMSGTICQEQNENLKPVLESWLLALVKGEKNLQVEKHLLSDEVNPAERVADLIVEMLNMDES